MSMIRRRKLSPARDAQRAKALLTAMLFVLLTDAARAAETAPTTQPAARAEQTPTQPVAAASSHYLRVLEDKNRSIALEIATREFVHPQGKGPRVALVGVAHIGDRAFYQSLQKLLEGYDIVLFESVKPPGAGGAGGDSAEERVESTKAAIQFVGGLIESYHRAHGKYPTSLDVLQDYAATRDARLAKFLAIASTDAWGRPLRYTAIAGEDGDRFTLKSLGADDAAGGADENTDLDLADQHPPDPTMLSKDDGLQSQLADALGLQFQLEALSYDQDNWRCSDMAIDEVNRRLQAKGLDFNLIGGTLAGSSFPAKIVKVLLGFMKFADAMLDGAVSDGFKVIMIEMLGDERLTSQGLDQLGAGFAEVIVKDRNQVAIDDLKRLIEKEPQTKSVAILYGAAHMPDMADRLHEQLGYVPCENGERWLTAMKVNFEESAISPQDVRQLRIMMRQAIRQQFPKK